MAEEQDQCGVIPCPVPAYSLCSSQLSITAGCSKQECGCDNSQAVTLRQLNVSCLAAHLYCQCSSKAELTVHCTVHQHT